MYLTTDQIIELGVDGYTVKSKISNGEWKVRQQRSGRRGKHVSAVLLASLPSGLQVKWLNNQVSNENRDKPKGVPIEADNVSRLSEKMLITQLLRFKPEERVAWIKEAGRLGTIIERFAAIKPKRQLDPTTDKYRFVPAVLELCKEAACVDQLILAREQHRASPPSPHTLERWLNYYKQEGLLTFFRSAPIVSADKSDNRTAVISRGAVEWVNSHWREFASPRHLFKALKKQANAQRWIIPGESWFYRRWQMMPEIVRTFLLEGEKSYISKYAPYVPRDFSDLQVLQVVCGDHSERDVTVLLKDGTLSRPWLSLWYDLRAGLIWGWHLDLIPSSNTAALAYADGVMNFGAQPISRPEEGFYSFVYTDRGRDYRSHNWDGKLIVVHKQAMRIEGGLEFLLTQQRVGILDEFTIKHLVAKRQNAREKPVERVFRDISDWEQNSFSEFCGRDAKSRPNKWRKLYARHQQLSRSMRGKSPFMTFEEYRERLAAFITEYNHSTHERLTVGGEKVVPIEEYKRLYTTKYEIAQETLILLLMKSDKRVIRKNGVQCFQKHWFYYNEAMADYKGLTVEVRYSDGDYSRVWVVLPNGSICEAILITPSSIINPNKQTLKTIGDAMAHERKVIRDFNLITQSQIRGETIEDRVTKQLKADEHTLEEAESTDSQSKRATVYKITRMDRRKLRKLKRSREATASEVANTKADTSIFRSNQSTPLNEFGRGDN
jgi:hypothetical protein